MAVSTRESRLTAAFVTLADTLVADYDVVDLLHTLVETCAELLDASAAGLMLANSRGALEVVASTSEQSRLVDLMQLHAGEGPCVESFLTGDVVVIDDVDALDRWPRFRGSALEQGFRSVHSVPLRLRGTTIGTLNLFRGQPGVLSVEDSAVARGLADVATIGILHERAVRESDIARQQLQLALDSRVVIEQAKGVIAQTMDLGVDEAFQLIRRHARAHSESLRDVSQRIVSRTLVL